MGLPGPGALRVGRFIGRVGVVSLRAVEVGLALDERVVRRHVAKLEAVGWLQRAPWVWGEGSVAWLTGRGLKGTGLGGLHAVKAPPAPTTIAHGVLVGWCAARMERCGRRWQSARELALDFDKWAAPMRDERGGTPNRLPDLAVWPPGSSAPVALIIDTGQRRDDRQRMILEGWRDAVHSGPYGRVQCDCASASVARRMTRLAEKVWLTAPEFVAAVQPGAEQIAAMAAAAQAPKAEGPISNGAATTHTDALGHAEPRRPPPPASAPVQTREPPPSPAPDSAEGAASREQLYREIFGMPEPRARRRWRR